MVIEQDPLVFYQWFPTAALTWLIVVAALGFGVLIVSFVVSTIRFGPWAAERVLYGTLAGVPGDLIRISPRRVFALARLAIQESLRRWVLAALGLYVVFLMFLSWYEPGGLEPAKQNIDNVLWSTALLCLVVVGFLSAFSLPTDIANKTIYTVVTKPVRASEIVLGRILGFTAVGTMLLIAAGAIGYVFVVRSVAHDHLIEASAVTPITAPGSDEVIGYEGRTSRDFDHFHQFTLDADGNGATETVRGHWHQVTAVTDESTGQRTYVVGPHQGAFTARMPIYGRLVFKDRNGANVDKGISVGDEWTYRSYIEGATQAAAVWTFDGIVPDRFPAEEDEFADGIPLDLSLQVFRTHKGDIEQTVRGSIAYRNPRTGLTSPEATFGAKEFAIDRHVIPRSWKRDDGTTIDLFKDLVDEGRLQVEIKCIEPAQYFGMAQPDMYLRAGSRSFEMNFVKGCLGIGYQMVMLISLGVMWSTLLNTAVALLATFATGFMGFFTGDMASLASGRTEGGGLFESVYRLWTQRNLTTDLDPGLGSTMLQSMDLVLSVPLRLVAAVLPDMGQFANFNYVIEGYSIPPEAVLTQLVIVIGYMLPVTFAGYLILKIREVAK